MSQEFSLSDGIGDLPLGVIPNSYSPWGEYHCHPEEGRLGRWREATTHYGWARSGGAWRVVAEGDARALEQTLCAEDSYPLLLTGDATWATYTAQVSLRPLSFAGPCGLVVGYRHSRRFFALLASDGILSLTYRHHDAITELAACEMALDDRSYRRLRLLCTPSHLTALVDSDECFSAEVGDFVGGPVGLLATAPCRFRDFSVSGQLGPPPTQHGTLAPEAEAEPVVWARLDISAFGTDRNLRVGDINGDGRSELVFAQQQEYLGSGDFCAISCLTAVDLQGEVLWQVGTPSRQEQETTADLCYQVHDIDGCGRAEVIYTKDLELVIADGARGEPRISVPTPVAEPPRRCGGYPMARVIGDCLHFCDFSGTGRPDSMVLKDRYDQAWVYDAGLELRWTHRCKTGHYPASFDIDGDGKDELMLGYTMLSADGEVLWELDAIDHADSAVVGPLWSGGPPIVAVSGSDAGFFLLSAEGRLLRHHPIGHAQTICVARLRDDVEGLQIVVNTYWGAPGITLVLDSHGEVLEEFEPMHYACLLQPANWGPNGTDLVLLSTHPTEGGLMDGYGRRAVLFPDDGHPVLCSDVRDIDGDGVDEVLTWDFERLWIYKPGDRTGGEAVYPTRNPWCNDSSYRGQFSYPRGW